MGHLSGAPNFDPDQTGISLAMRAGAAFKGTSCELELLLNLMEQTRAVHRAQDLRPKDFKWRSKTRGGDLAKGIKVDLSQQETLQKELK